MLAQEMMQMVQSNPEIHGPMGMYNAYKRMYEAMGVQQVEQILPPTSASTTAYADGTCYGECKLHDDAACDTVPRSGP